MDRRTFVAFLSGISSLVVGCKRAAPKPEGPVPFGYKMGWITVRSERIQEVVELFRLRHAMPANWRDGIDFAYSSKGVFVAPPLHGWIAVVGYYSEDSVAGDPLATMKRRIELASEQFHTSCSFRTHRVTEHHYWMRAEEGRLTRCFAYVGDKGEILCNAGPVTLAEQALSFAKLPADQWHPDESDVMRIAGAWSYDPSKLTSSSGPAMLGVIADWP